MTFVTRKFPKRVGLEDFHLLLGILQLALAELQELGATLVGGKRLFQRQLTAFHGLDDSLEFRKCGLECQLFFGLGLGHEELARSGSGAIWISKQSKLSYGPSLGNVTLGNVTLRNATPGKATRQRRPLRIEGRSPSMCNPAALRNKWQAINWQAINCQMIATRLMAR